MKIKVKQYMVQHFLQGLRCVSKYSGWLWVKRLPHKGKEGKVIIIAVFLHRLLLPSVQTEYPPPKSAPFIELLSRSVLPNVFSLSPLGRKDTDAGKDGGQEEKG